MSIHSDGVAVHSLDFAAGAVVGNEPLVRPGFSFIQRDCAEQARDGMLLAQCAGDHHLLTEGSKEQRSFLEP